MNNSIYRAIIALQVMVILSLFVFITAGDQIITRLNGGQQAIELSEANLDR